MHKVSYEENGCYPATLFSLKEVCKCDMVLISSRFFTETRELFSTWTRGCSLLRPGLILAHTRAAPCSDQGCSLLRPGLLLAQTRATLCSDQGWSMLRPGAALCSDQGWFMLRPGTAHCSDQGLILAQTRGWSLIRPAVVIGLDQILMLQYYL